MQAAALPLVWIFQTLVRCSVPRLASASPTRELWLWVMITVNVRHRENQCWGGLNIFHWFLSWRLSLVRTFQGGEAWQFIKLLTSLGSCYIAACKTVCKFIFSWHRTNTSIDMSIYPRLLFLSFIIFKTQLSTSNISMIWIVLKVSTHSHAERRFHDTAADNSYLDIWRVIQLNTPPPLLRRPRRKFV